MSRPLTIDPMASVRGYHLRRLEQAAYRQSDGVVPLVAPEGDAAAIPTWSELPVTPSADDVGELVRIQTDNEAEPDRYVTALPLPDGRLEWRDINEGKAEWPAAFLAAFGGEGLTDGLFGEMIRRIAVDSAGNVYVASDDRIQKFSANGTWLATIATAGSGDGQVDEPGGLAIDPSNNLYVADTGNNRIQKFNSSGAFLAKAGTLGSGDNQYDAPAGISITTKLTSVALIVADTNNNRLVNVGQSDLLFLREIPEPLIPGDGPPGGFLSPIGVADGQGRVWVADTGNHRFVFFQSFFIGPAFFTAGELGASKGQFSGPHSIAVDDGGDVYVTDTGNHRVQVFDRNGIFRGLFGKPGAADGHFNGPTAIAVTDDYIYVADAGNFRIQIFTNPAAIETRYPRIVGTYSGTWAPAALAGDAGQATTVTIPGAQVGDYVEVAHSGARSNSFLVWLEAYVHSTNNVVVHAYNRHPTVAQTLGSGTLNVRVTR